MEAVVIEAGPGFFETMHIRTQSDTLPTTVIARTSGDAAALVVAMQRELRAVDVNAAGDYGDKDGQSLERRR